MSFLPLIKLEVRVVALTFARAFLPGCGLLNQGALGGSLTSLPDRADDFAGKRWVFNVEEPTHFQ